MNPLPNGFRERIREFFRRRGRRRPVHAYWRSASASSESLTSNAERDTSRLRQRRDRVESFLSRQSRRKMLSLTHSLIRIQQLSTSSISSCSRIICRLECGSDAGVAGKVSFQSTHLCVYMSIYSQRDATRWVPSDLPSICIESYNASCTICLMDFEEPKPISAFKWRILSPTRMAGSPEPLRQLRCRHVFHVCCFIFLVLATDR